MKDQNQIWNTEVDLQHPYISNMFPSLWELSLGHESMFTYQTTTTVTCVESDKSWLLWLWASPDSFTDHWPGSCSQATFQSIAFLGVRVELRKALGRWPKSTKKLHFQLLSSSSHWTLMLLVANLTNTKWWNALKMTETLAHGYSSESTQKELSNGYQHGRV